MYIYIFIHRPGRVYGKLNIQFTLYSGPPIYSISHTAASSVRRQISGSKIIYSVTHEHSHMNIRTRTAYRDPEPAPLTSHLSPRLTCSWKDHSTPEIGAHFSHGSPWVPYLGSRASRIHTVVYIYNNVGGAQDTACFMVKTVVYYIQRERNSR